MFLNSLFSVQLCTVLYRGKQRAAAVHGGNVLNVVCSWQEHKAVLERNMQCI